MVKPKLWFHLVRHNCVSNAWSLTRLTLMANGCWACAVSIRRAAIGFRLDTSLMANRRLLSLSLASAASVALRPLTSSEPTSFEDRGRGRASHEHGVPVHGDHAAEIVHTKKHLPPRSCYQSPSRRNEHFRAPDVESSLGHRILVDHAILHNDQKVFVGIFDELDIFQRISIDQQQIGKCAFFHNTKLAGIGIDKSGECH